MWHGGGPLAVSGRGARPYRRPRESPTAPVIACLPASSRWDHNAAASLVAPRRAPLLSPTPSRRPFAHRSPFSLAAPRASPSQRRRARSNSNFGSTRRRPRPLARTPARRTPRAATPLLWPRRSDPDGLQSLLWAKVHHQSRSQLQGRSRARGWACKGKRGPRHAWGREEPGGGWGARPESAMGDGTARQEQTEPPGPAQTTRREAKNGKTVQRTPGSAFGVRFLKRRFWPRFGRQSRGCTLRCGVGHPRRCGRGARNAPPPEVRTILRKSLRRSPHLASS